MGAVVADGKAVWYGRLSDRSGGLGKAASPLFLQQRSCQRCNGTSGGWTVRRPVSHMTLYATFRRSGWLLAAAIIGAYFRFDQIGQQLVIGDEWHALHVALNASHSRIAGSFGIADHSIPLALYYKGMLETVGLDLWGLRAPVLLSGLLTVILLPLMCRPLMPLPPCCPSWQSFPSIVGGARARGDGWPSTSSALRSRAISCS
jgi:hypothetical protein